MDWIETRLNELGQSKRKLAEYIGVRADRINMFQNGTWRFQICHIKKLAEFLKLDRLALIDFLSGDISEEELLNTKPVNVSQKDIELLNAIKYFAKDSNNEEKTQNTKKQKENDR
jgi:transcriptional regulator with XRE-family HTH domain